MKRSILYIFIFLLANEVFGQKMLIEQLARARKIPMNTQRDSVVIDVIHQLTQCASFENERWRDSINYYCTHKQNQIACLLHAIREADKGVNSMTGKRSIENLLAIGKELESKKYYSHAAYAYMRIGAIYNYILSDQQDRVNALTYYQKALKLAFIANSKFELARSYDYIGEYYLSLKNYDRAIYFLKIAEQWQLKSDFRPALPTIYSSISACYLNKNDVKSAEVYYKKTEKVLQYEASFLHPEYKRYVLHIFIKSAADYFYTNGNFDKSLVYCLEGIKIVNEIHNVGKYRNDSELYRLNFFEIAQKCYAKKKDFKKAYFYLNEYEIAKNKLNNIVHSKEISEFNIKYQTEQNKLRITALENESLKKDYERQAVLRYFVITLIFLLILVIGIAIYSNLKLRKKNKEILTAMLKGQATERKRVASDLHDNLGSTLSSIQWSLQAIDTSKMKVSELNVHRNLNQMLENAYNQVRLLSHNLLPEDLEKQGLKPTLESFVRKINKNGGLKLKLSFSENFPRLAPQIEFELYSICLELTNNILKHAAATEAAMVFELAEARLKLTVTDNGRGINKNSSKGYGLNNVAERVASLKGTWIVKSAQDEGTENLIELPF